MAIQLAHAQSAGDIIASSPNADRQIEGWRAQLDQISSAIKRDGITVKELLEFRTRVTVIRNDAVDFVEKRTPEIQNLTTRLKKLNQATNGAPVSDKPQTQSSNSTAGQSIETPTSKAADEEIPSPSERTHQTTIEEETTNIIQRSKAEQALSKDKVSLEATISRINAQLGRTQVIILRAKELIGNITQLRRTKFTSRLFGRASSLLAPSLWVSAIQEIVPLTNGLIAIVSNGSNRVLNEAPLLFLISLVGSLSLCYLLTRYFRPPTLRPMSSHSNKTSDNENQARHTRGLNALYQILRSLTFITLTPALLLFVLNQADVLASRLSELLWVVLQAIFYYSVARGLSRAIYAPALPDYRLIDVDDVHASRAHKTVMICLTIALIGFVIINFARTLVASLDVIILVYGTMSATFSIVALGSYFTRKREQGVAAPILPNILVIRILGIFVFLGLLVALAAPIAGFPFLGAFAITQVILAGIISAILYLCFMLLDTYLGADSENLSDTRPIPRSSEEGGLRYTQIMLLLAGTGKVLLTILGIGIFAASWGLDTSGIWEDLARFSEEIKIGELIISPTTIITAVIVLAIGILITRSLKRWFANVFLPTTTLDIGLRNSIVTGLGYLGFIASAMIAFSQAGLDLSNLAIVAGALSLGIGFGLQSIVSNFVSGIILLAERPIKSGDWIEVGGEQGTVRKISVRSTEIETFDRATVIVPNADFISGSVKNMMYGNTIGRFILTIGVGYDSDPDQVRDILLECAKNHPLVLAYPESYVIFSDFGASSLDFELRGYLADCGNSLSVRSDLRFALFKRLKEEGIEIPFPQQDVHLKNISTLKGISSSQTDEATSQSTMTSTPPRHDEIEADSGEH